MATSAETELSSDEPLRRERRALLRLHLPVGVAQHAISNPRATDAGGPGLPPWSRGGRGRAQESSTGVLRSAHFWAGPAPRQLRLLRARLLEAPLLPAPGGARRRSIIGRDEPHLPDPRLREKARRSGPFPYRQRINYPQNYESRVSAATNQNSVQVWSPERHLIRCEGCQGFVVVFGVGRTFDS